MRKKRWLALTALAAAPVILAWQVRQAGVREAASWQPRTLAVADPRARFETRIETVNWSNDGRSLFMEMEFRLQDQITISVHEWDVRTRTFKRSIPVTAFEPGERKNYSFHPSKRAMSAHFHAAVEESAPSVVRLKSRDGRFGRKLAGHTGRVRSFAFSPDGRTLATASYDGTVKLWRVR